MVLMLLTTVKQKQPPARRSLSDLRLHRSQPHSLRTPPYRFLCANFELNMRN